MVTDAERIEQLEARLETLSELVLRSTITNLQASQRAIDAELRGETAQPPAPAAEPEPAEPEESDEVQMLRRLADPSTFGTLEDFDAHLQRKIAPLNGSKQQTPKPRQDDFMAAHLRAKYNVAPDGPGAA